MADINNKLNQTKKELDNIKDVAKEAEEQIRHTVEASNGINNTGIDDYTKSLLNAATAAKELGIQQNKISNKSITQKVTIKPEVDLSDSVKQIAKQIGDEGALKELAQNQAKVQLKGAAITGGNAPEIINQQEINAVKEQKESVEELVKAEEKQIETAQKVVQANSKIKAPKINTSSVPNPQKVAADYLIQQGLMEKQAKKQEEEIKKQQEDIRKKEEEEAKAFFGTSYTSREDAIKNAAERVKKIEEEKLQMKLKDSQVEQQNTAEFINNEQKKIESINNEKAAMEQLEKVYERVQKGKEILNDVIRAFTGMPVDKFFDLVRTNSNSLYGFKSEEVNKGYTAKDNSETTMSINGKKYKLTIDEDKILEDSQREALQNFIKFVNELNKIESNIAFLNSTNRGNLLTTDTKVPLEKYQNAYRIEGISGNKNYTGVNSVARDGYLYEITEDSFEKMNEDNKLFLYTFQQRLNGFLDENGNYKVGYKDIAKNLEELEKEIVKAIPIMALFSKATTDSISGMYGTSDKDILNEIVAQRLALLGINKEANEITPGDRNKALTTFNDSVIGNILQKIMVDSNGNEKDISLYSDFIGNQLKAVFTQGKLSVDTSQLNESQKANIEQDVTRLEEAFKNITNAFEYYPEIIRSETQRELKSGVGAVGNTASAGDKAAYTDLETHVQNFNNAMGIVEEGVKRFNEALETGDRDKIVSALEDEYVQRMASSRINAADELKYLQESQYADNLANLTNASGQLVADLDKMQSQMEAVSATIAYADYSKLNDSLQEIVNNAEKVKVLDNKIKDENIQRNNDAIINEYGQNRFKEFNLSNEIKQLEYINNTGLLNNKDIDANNQRIDDLKGKLEEVKNSLQSLRDEANTTGVDITQQEGKINDMLGILTSGIGVFGVGYVGMMNQLSKSKAGATLDNIRQAAKDNNVQGVVGNEQFIQDDLSRLKNDIGKIVIDSVYNDLTNQAKSLPKGQTKQLNILNNLRGNLGNVITGKDTVALEGYKSRTELEGAINDIKGQLDSAKQALEELKLKNTDGKLDDKIHNFEKTIDKLNDKYAYILSGYNNESSYDELEKAYRSSIPLSSDIKGVTSDINYLAQKSGGGSYEQTLDKLHNKIEQVTNFIQKSVSKVISIVKKAHDIVVKSITITIGIFEKLGSAIQRIIQLFGNLGNRIGIFNKQGNILKGTYTELKSKIDLLVGAFNKLYNNSFINEGKKLLSSVQTLNMLIGTELTTKTMEWATNLEHAFGLSASGLITDLKELTAVMYGLGMSASDVQVAATNLEAVAMSLSATTGYDFSTVVNKIQSGMKGMTQSIDDLGLSVRESQMDAFLKKLKAQGGEYANIGTSFSQLTEQQRIYVRYAAIMDQFTSKEAYSAENYAKSLRTITGSLSILNSQIRGLKSDIGSLALQLFAKIIQPLIYIIYLVRQAVKWFANLLGIDITLNPKMNGSEDNVIQPIEDTTKALDEEAAAADKAKGSLDGLDHVSTMSESSSKNKGDAFDYSSLMNISDDYAKLLEDLGKMQDDFIEECKRKFWEMVNSIKDKFTQWVKDVTGRIIDWDSIKEKWDVIIENLKESLKHIKGIFEGLRDIIGGLLYSIFDDLDAMTLLEKFSGTIERFTHLIEIILKRVQPYIQNFYDKYLSPYVVKFGDWLADKLDEANNKLDEWLGWWQTHENDEKIQGFFDNLGEKFNQLAIIIKTLFGGKSSLKINDVHFIDNSESNTFKNLVDLAENIHWIINGILGVIKSIAEEIGIITSDAEGLHINPEFINGVLETINEKLNNISTWLNENKEEIAKIISAVTDAIGQIAEAEFDKLMEVLNWLTDHSEFVAKTLDVISDIIAKIIDNIEWIIAIGLIAKVVTFTSKISLTILKFKALSKIVGGTGAGGGVVGLFGKLVTKIKAIPGAIATIPAKLTSLGAKFTSLGTKILTCFTTTWVGPFVAAIGTIALAVAELKQGWEDFKFNIEDTELDFSGAFGAFTDENGKKLEVTTQNTKQWAYDIRVALEKVYGDNIPTDAFDRAMSHVMMELEATGDFTFEQTEAIRKNIEKQYNNIGVIDAFDNMAYYTENSTNVINGIVDGLRENTETAMEDMTDDVREAGKSIEELPNSFAKAANGSTTAVGTIQRNFNKLYKDISYVTRHLSNEIGTLYSRVGIVVSQAESIRRASQNTVNNSAGWSTKKLKTFYGNANGGVPSSGSLFLANENGNAELVGNFGGYTGVANQSMIIEAMQNAMVQAIRSAGGMGNGGTTVNNFNIGNWLGDDASVRKLANRINTVNAKSNSNIANVGFVMS